MTAPAAPGAQPRTTLIRCIHQPIGWDYIISPGPFRETDERAKAHRFTAAEAASWIDGRRGSWWLGPEDFVTDGAEAQGDLFAGVT